MLPAVELGRTGLTVAKLGYGGLELRDLTIAGGRLPSEEQAGALLDAVLDAGINFIDTAPSYGRSEELIGRFAARRRGEYFLSTKCGRAYRGSPPGGSEWSRAAILDSIDGSLRRLCTDYVDVLKLHGPTIEDVERFDCIATLREVQAQGKARFIGVSAVLPDLDSFISMDVFDVFQIVFSALEPEHEAAMARAAALGAGVVVRGGATKGAPVRDEGRGREWPVVKERWERSGLREALAAHDPVEVLLRYAVFHAHVHTAIVGTVNLAHIAANVRAVEDGPLDDELVALIRTSVSGVL